MAPGDVVDVAAGHALGDRGVVQACVSGPDERGDGGLDHLGSIGPSGRLEPEAIDPGASDLRPFPGRRRRPTLGRSGGSCRMEVHGMARQRVIGATGLLATCTAR